MDRDAYVIYSASLQGGGPWGINEVVTLAFLENLTGRPIADFFDAFTGNSIGALIAAVLTTADPKNPGKPRISAELTAKAFFPIVLALFNSNRYLLTKQTADRAVRAVTAFVTNRFQDTNIIDGHFNHDILREALEPLFGDAKLGDSLKTVLMLAHNMERKKTDYFGCVHGDLFNVEGLKAARLVNGRTPVISAIMASTSLPGIFRMHHDKEQNLHYTDLAPYATPMPAYMDLLRMARLRQKAIHARRTRTPLQRMAKRVARAFRLAITGSPILAARTISAPFNRRALNAVKTLATTSDVVVRNIYFCCGDTDLPFDPARQASGGVLGHISHERYGAFQASSAQVHQLELETLAAEFDERVIAVTGKPACTIINKSMRSDDPKIQKTLPSLGQTDGSLENLYKIYAFAKGMVMDNLDTLRDLVREITEEKYARRQFTRSERDRIITAVDTLTPEKASAMLDKIIVTPDNAFDVSKMVTQMMAGHAVDNPHLRRIKKPVANAQVQQVA